MSLLNARTLRGRRLQLLAALLGATGAVLALLVSTGPVLYSYVEPGDPTHEPSWSVLNPLRSRAPERPAQTLLGALRDGRAQEVLPPLVRDHKMGPAVIVESELECRLVSWRLIQRKDEADTSALLYHAVRNDAPDDEARPIRIRVERTPKGGTWRVTGYSAVY